MKIFILCTIISSVVAFRDNLGIGDIYGIERKLHQSFSGKPIVFFHSKLCKLFFYLIDMLNEHSKNQRWWVMWLNVNTELWAIFSSKKETPLMNQSWLWILFRGTEYVLLLFPFSTTVGCHCVTRRRCSVRFKQLQWKFSRNSYDFWCVK